jgi:hypothetical protein
LRDIATTIKTHTDGGTHIIDLGNVSDSSIVAEVKRKGWNVYYNGKLYNNGKYKGCLTVGNVEKVDSNYKTSDIVDGVWSEGLWDLTNGSSMFSSCENLTSFTSDLPSLTNG